MQNIFAAVLFCAFWTFAIFFILKKILLAIFKEEKVMPQTPFMVITAKNCENSVEFDFRTYIWRLLAENGGSLPFDICAVDLNSADGTLDVLKKLEGEYEFLHALNKAEFVDMIENEFK